MSTERPLSSQPLPDHAKKVFSGVMFDVYQWEQEMFDGSTATFEKLKRPDTVITFPVTAEGKILLTRQEQPGKAPFIGAAGGRVDLGEDIEAAAWREMREETGCEADELILWKAFQPTSKIEWALFFFIARDARKVAGLSLDAGEKIDVIEVTFDEFLETVLRPDFMEKEIVRDVLEAKLDSEKMADLKRLFGQSA